MVISWFDTPGNTCLSQYVRPIPFFLFHFNLILIAVYFIIEMVDSTSSLRQQKSSPFDGPRKFYKDSVLFLHRCTKPDRRGKFYHIPRLTNISTSFFD